MTKSFPSILPIADPFKGILLDAYGVFWGGNLMGLLPGSDHTMKKLVAAGKIVGILSNTTQMASKEIEKLNKHGLELDVHFHFLITSGEIAKKFFSTGSLPFPTPKKKYWLFDEDHPRFFEGSPFTQTLDLQEADFIYISIPRMGGKDQTDPEIFRARVEKLKETNLPMVCANPDRFAHEGSPPQAVVRQGSIAAIYEELGGKVFYIGKPSMVAFQRAMEQFGEHQIHQPVDILMVGDTPETDIRGARRYGMHAALTTKTGIFAERQGELPPMDTPHFYIERLADV